MHRSPYHLCLRLPRFKKSRRLEEESGAVSTPFGMHRGLHHTLSKESLEGLQASEVSEGAPATTMEVASTAGSKATCQRNAQSQRRREVSEEASEVAVEEPEMEETWAEVQGPSSIGLSKTVRLDGALFNRAHLSLRHPHGVVLLTLL